MEQQGTSMTDTGPLVKLKNAMQRIQEEIGQFEVRLGVVEHALLESRAKAKKTGPMFGTLQI